MKKGQDSSWYSSASVIGDDALTSVQRVAMPSDSGGVRESSRTCRGRKEERLKKASECYVTNDQMIVFWFNNNLSSFAY